MASTNQSPFYKQAELKFLNAKNNEEKLTALEEMMRECPKHKSSEKMLANLKTRYVKLKEKIESQKKTSKGSSKKGIKKEEMQAVIIGLPNSGKSSLLSLLTNTKPAIATYDLTTKTPQVGMMNYLGTQIQLIEIPAIGSEYYNRGLVNTTDSIIILIKDLKEIKEIGDQIERAQGKRIMVFNKIDLLDENQKRKIFSTLQSKKYDFILISTETREGIEELKEKIFKTFNKIRIFTKEPGKPKSEKPIILQPNTNIEQVAEKILHGFSKRVKETKIWGPSSKFSGQIVGMKHRLKDLDVVEFKTR